MKQNKKLKKYYIEVSGTFVVTAEVMANSEEEVREKRHSIHIPLDLSRDYVEVWTNDK